MKNQVCIILGNDHYNTLNVIRSLGVSGIEVYAIIVSDKLKSFVLKSRYISKGELVRQADITHIINKYAKPDIRIPILGTCDSLAAFLDENYDILVKYFILPSIGNTQRMLVNEMDKNIQLKHAKKAGFDIPHSVAIQLNNLSDSTLTDIRYPCIIKPKESIEGSKNDFSICHNEDELKKNLKSLSGRLNQVLVQQFIPNDHVILIAGVRTHFGDNYVFGEINKLKHGCQPQNLGLNCIGVLNPTSELRDACINYVDSIDYHGCYSIEVVRIGTTSAPTQNMNFFIEINLRTDGLLYFYQKAGINFPEIWVKSCYGEKVNFIPSKQKVYGMNEFLYFRHYLSGSTFTDLLKTDIFSTFSIYDIKPFIYKFIYHN